MADEPSNGELARRLEAVHQDLKEDFRELAARLDAKVSMERYQLEQLAALERERVLGERVRAIEQAREQEKQQRANDRRLLFTALIAPVIMLLLTLYVNSRGAG